MTVRLPDYYSALGPFREHFGKGHPILCYHKTEPVPPGARIKGLYVEPALFRQQIGELAQAGFSFVAPGASPKEKPITITFDDGFVSNLQSAVPVMREFGCQAINYLVADRIGKTSDWEAAEGGEARPVMNDVQIREWMAAGNWIGAHTCTHPRLSQIPRDRAREEITTSKKKLEDRFGIPIDHFAYPYGDYDDAVVEMVREAGFRTACTMDRGVNYQNADPFRLKRWTARYPTRTLGSMIRRLFR
ncbi:MAG: polysaccharide deacetylase family protein [Verrucomicrobia bacterium]|nr:polysaccharide deacetylase family protein [Verrucomicrobiota bacterium]